jgi:DNA-binding response OmpR family regulator
MAVHYLQVVPEQHAAGGAIVFQVNRCVVNTISLSILIIEDNAQLAANIYDYLEACGHSLDAAPDGVSGLNLAATKDYDAIVLDWNLPRMDGLSLLRRLRIDEKKTVPVIMLTARDQLADKIDGFESGVDDYLVKPVALPELEIRLRSLVARLRQSIAPDHVLTVGDLSFNVRTMEVARGGRQVQLSRTSRHLLELLMRESPKVVARERLEQVAWGEETPEIDLLRSHMYVLRRAIDQGSQRKLLHTVSGVGYRLCELD